MAGSLTPASAGARSLWKRRCYRRRSHSNDQHATPAGMGKGQPAPPRRSTGPTGPTGATGATGTVASTVVAVSATTSTGGGPVLGAKTPIASVTCPAGHPKLVGGGANANGGGTSVGAVEF
jgi:hypothetical protein